MDRALLADSIVNLCGAVGLAIAVLIFRARDPRGALTRRFTATLGLIAVVFLLRALAWSSGSAFVDRIAVACAALIPLGALIVVEGVLLRHAPRPLKLVTLLGALALAAFALVLPATPIDIGLAVFQIGIFAACALLLMTYPAGTLSAGEAIAIRRLCIAAFVLLPFIATDFRGLWPGIPVRAGALGALIVVTFALVADAASGTRRGHAVLIGLRLGSGLLLGLAFAALSPAAGPAETVRLVVVALSGVLTIGLVVEAARAWLAAGEPGVLSMVANARGLSRPALIEHLMQARLFDGASRLDEATLADFDPDILRDHLAGVFVLRRADHPWGRDRADAVTERLQALLATHQASHLIVVDHAPLDLIVLRMPLILADRAAETGLLLAGRLLGSARGT
jgi:hypothetical protein